MGLLERIIFFTIGAGLGFILGYVVARLQVIEKKVDDVKDEVQEVDDIVKNNLPRRTDQAGFMRFPVVADVALLLVIAIVVGGTLMAQRATNQVQQATACNRDYLANVIDTVNERTTYAADQARLNIELQRAQSVFLGILLERPPPTNSRRNEALREYFVALSNFIEVNAKAQAKALDNPYPTVEQFDMCLTKDNEDE